MTHTILTGDSAELLKSYPDGHFDSIVTDPPYGIEFLGKEWDRNTGAVEIWQECLRVLKPGGHLLAFSAARTYHHLATNIESVGFEIRDQLMWLYASGFPKAQDIGKSIQRRQGVEETVEKEMIMQGGFDNWADTQEDKNATRSNQTIQEVIPTSPEAKAWAGWKTALKPAHEPIVMARKPFKGSTIDNVLTHGVGALNIDDNRIGNEKTKTVIKRNEENTLWYGARGNKESVPKPVDEIENQGRFPSNVMGEVTGYQKFFYCPKVSRKERHTGFDTTDIPTNPSGMYEQDERGKCGERYEARVEEPRTGNNHPTVKPVALMRYLIQLVTPPNSRVLDPFCGSGSTGMAAVELGHEFIGCEQNSDYTDIARKRIEGWLKPNSHTPFNKLFEVDKNSQ